MRRLAGFTLLELILALALAAALFGAVILNVPAWAESQRLEEGALRVETMLAMARADAANLGKKLRLSFQAGDDGLTRIDVLWEADPVGAPEHFTEYAACTWLHHLPSGLVRVTRCQLQGSSAYRLLDSDTAGKQSAADNPLAALTFYPDGSCDSAVIELASTSASDQRGARVEIEGLTGSITRRMLGRSELSE